MRLERIIVVSPHIRPDGTRHPNAFEARFADALLCISETPLFDAARVLLARGIAQPDDTIVMRHAGSGVDALRARFGVAAGLTVEDTPSRRLRVRKYRGICGDVAPRIARTMAGVSEPPAAKTAPAAAA